MNIQKYNIMNKIMEHADKNQRKLSEITGYSVGKVNSSIRQLKDEGYLTADMQLTNKAWKELEEKRPRNAIILAAGYGMRMVPINVEVPKGLLKVKEEALIERLICQLHEAGVYEIDIVVGFMKEQYEYLIDKYNVNLIFNREYSSKNNLHSLNCVSEKLGNTYIIPCDVWSKVNPFSNHEWYSWYMVTNEPDDRSSVRVNRKKELVTVKDDETGNKMIGISYILNDDAGELKNNLCKMSERKAYDQSFWETALFDGCRMIIAPKEVNADDVFEINTYEQLRELDSNSDQLQSEIIHLIAAVLSCDEQEITEIESLKKGMTNRSFRFRCRGKYYIMRVPGEGTAKMINRQQEYEVYRQLQGKGISDPVVYMSPENGYKITEFIQEARSCNAEDFQDVKKCMQYLRRFHELNLKVNHEFNLYEQIEYYETLWNGEASVYRDYRETKANIYKLKNYIDKQPRQIALTHIDAVSDNFLIKGDKVFLIDWEYAGMQDVHVDIAMFAIYAMYDREKIDCLIQAYFPEGVDEMIRIKIYCYIAICGLLWSNWCEYKRMCGVEFGEYSIKQYRYAKEFYRIVKKELGEELEI